jgi:hypothetical protein
LPLTKERALRAALLASPLQNGVRITSPQLKYPKGLRITPPHLRFPTLIFRSFALKLRQKGLESLADPMLRGSFCLVLSAQRLDYFDNIAKTAYLQITSYRRYVPSTTAQALRTIHLNTDPGSIINKRPGVYVIQNVISGVASTGQTKDFRKRFNQYSSRSFDTSLDTARINKNYAAAAQQEINNGLYPSQIFRRFVVYTWVDDNKQHLDIDNSIVLRNEMAYLEHRLILAFYASRSCYNVNDSFPQLTENGSLPTSPTVVVNTPKVFVNEQKAVVNKQKAVVNKQKAVVNKQKAVVNEQKAVAGQGPKNPGTKNKPFKAYGFYFLSSNDYLTFRATHDQIEIKNFLHAPAMRNLLNRNENNFEADTRYLLPEEIITAKQRNWFIKLERPAKIKNSD